MPGRRRGWARGGNGGFSPQQSPFANVLLEPALLLLLKENPRHGYTLLSDLSLFDIKPIHPSIVYRALREMEEMEWIKSDWDALQTQGPPRRMYSLTTLGKETLDTWRTELEKTRQVIGKLLVRAEQE